MDTALSGWLMTVKVVNILLDGSCFSIGCGNPKLELHFFQPINPATFGVNWPIDPNNPTVLPSPAVWTSFFPTETGRNVSIQSLLTGTDLTYKFPRVCATSTRMHASVGSTELSLDAPCFNVSLIVSWLCSYGKVCSDGPDNESNCDDDNDALRSVFLADGSFSRSVPIWLTFVLGGVILVLVCFCLCLLSLYFHQRGHQGSRHGRKYPPVNAAICRSLSTESKYDVPWDQKFRPLPDYVRELANGSPGLSTDSHE